MTAPDFPFPSPDGFSHPPLFAELRSNAPVAKVTMPTGDPAWLVSRYEDVRFVLSDNRFSSAATTDPDVPHLSPMYDMPKTMLTTDPPEHTRLRRLVAREFTGPRVEALRPMVQRITDEALDGMRRQGPPADLHAALAMTLPVSVICELLGVPYADWPRFRELSDAVLSLTGRPVDEMRQARDELLRYMAGLVAAKRADPTDDLLSALAVGDRDGDALDEKEAVAVGAFVLAAGYESTVAQIGMGVVALLRSPDQYRALTEDPALVPGAVEELLRAAGPGAGALLRIAIEDVELAGVTIRSGEAVLAAVGSANRDDRRFPDGTTLDIRRQHNPHIAFGSGIHRCLGAALARLELEVVVGTLARRFPTLALAVPVHELPWRQGSRLYGLLALPVTW